jgi:hypothetical protein
VNACDSLEYKARLQGHCRVYFENDLAVLALFSKDAGLQLVPFHGILNPNPNFFPRKFAKKYEW